jgi:hypothetical protein|tara:strand:- start:5228 stop:5428 length:201 start_codon:yes stop_codon:yes gene_type:complete
MVVVIALPLPHTTEPELKLTETPPMGGSALKAAIIVAAFALYAILSVTKPKILATNEPDDPEQVYV